MRHLIVTLLATMPLTLFAPLHADVAQPDPVDAETDDTGLTDDEAGYDAAQWDEENDPEWGTENGWGYDSADFSAFEEDDLIEDEYGYYDADFDWDVDDDDWDAWYEAEPEAWDNGEEDGFFNW